MSEGFVAEIKEKGKSGVIKYVDVLEISNKHRLSISEVEIRALENGIIPERYLRNQSSLGSDDQLKLLKSSVCVVGLGGLGCYACEELARLGVGKIIICDHDAYDPKNLNRQIFCDHESLLLDKVIVAESRIRDVNPAVKVVSHKEKFSSEKRHFIIDGAQVVLDCTDNYETRSCLLDACRDMGIVLIHGSIGGWYGQVSVIHPEDDIVRGIIKSASRVGIENQVGNLAFTAGVISSIMVSETIKALLKKDTPLKNRILFIDLLNLEFILMG